MSSGKDAMDKPAQRLVPTMETRPEQPEAPPFLVLDSVIVADCITGTRPLWPPPFVGDPLRPVGPRDPVPTPAPSEAERRIVRQEPERLDRLRWLEEPDRPRRFVRGWCNGSVRVSAGDRHPDRGAFRDMAFARFEPRHCSEPQPVAEPVEERRNAVRFVGRGMASQADLLWRQRLDRKGGEDHVFDAEPRIDGVKPLLEERHEVARIAAQASGAEADPLDSAVDAMKGEIEVSRSDPLLRQAGNEILDEPLGRAQQIGWIDNRLGEAQPHPPGRRFAQWRQRFR